MRQQSGLRSLVLITSCDWWLTVSAASYKDSTFFLSLSLSRCYSLAFSVYSYWFTTTVSSFPHIQRARAQTLMILSKLPCGRRTNSATCYIFVKRHSFPLKQSSNLLSPCLISPCLCLKAIISLAFFFLQVSIIHSFSRGTGVRRHFQRKVSLTDVDESKEREIKRTEQHRTYKCIH